MSRLILTMGRTARTPYLIEKIERKVYTIEELCYSLAQCAQLLDDSIRDPDLVIWLGSECGLTDLSVKLRPWLDRRNAYVEFVMVILEYAAYQSPARQKEIRREMEESEGMEPYRQLLARAEYSAGQGRIGQAQSELDGVLAALPELEREMRSRVWQQKGRLYAGQFSFRKASDCYYRAWKLTHDRHSGKCYLAALRMVTSQEEWDDYIGEHPELYEHALLVRQGIEQAQAACRAGSEGRTIRKMKQYLREGRTEELRSLLDQKATATGRPTCRP